MRLMGEIDDDVKDNVLELYLDLAKEKLLNHLYPYGHEQVELDKRYDLKQVELAIILWNKRGAEGENSHNENGVNRAYQSEEKFFASIPRYAEIL